MNMYARAWRDESVRRVCTCATMGIMVGAVVWDSIIVGVRVRAMLLCLVAYVYVCAAE